MIQYRSYNPQTDKAFIYSTWLKGLYYGNSYFGSMEKQIFFDKYERILDHIMNKPGVEIRIAGLADDADSILGYIVRNGPVVHWCHVKSAWRRQGIARELHGTTDSTTVTHITPAGNSIRLKMGLVHNPWAV